MDKGSCRAALFLLLTLGLMLLLRLLPSGSLCGLELSRVDVMADVVASSPTETLPIAPVATQPAAGKTAVAEAGGKVSAQTQAAGDSIRRTKDGVVCIEDYAPDSSRHGMASFYAALARRGSLGRPVRIAYFGDSYIEGDILTADLRAFLQRRFGGRGVGFVDIASPFIKLRSTVVHSAQGWTDHNVLEKQGVNHALLGISQRYAVAGSGATATYRGTKTYAGLDTFTVATLYVAGGSPQTVTLTANGQTEHRTLSGSRAVEAVTHRGRMGRVSFSVGQGAVCYGVALEDTAGVVLDNFSLRGSSGMPLASVPMRHLTALHDVRPYDLIVLQFGLNVASKNQTNYAGYRRQMARAIDHLKRAFPSAAILVVSVGDREDRVDGQLRTMPGIKALVSEQRTLAAETGVSFWNLFEAMGGEGAIRRMAEAQPAEAGRDYTHINHRGGRRLAGIMYKALMDGYERFR